MNYLNEFLKPFVSVGEDFKDFLVPKKAYSWQLLIYLSIFSLIMSFLAVKESFVQNLIAYCGWFFLIAGTAWYTTDKPVNIPGTNMPIGAIVTAGLVSIFFFSPNDNEILRPVSIVLWPTIAAVITAIPEFFEGSGTDVKRQVPKVDTRQELTILIAVCMMLSCWINLYFLVDRWLQEYPSLAADSYRTSILVRRQELQPEQKPPQNGALLLERLTPIVEQQISSQPWARVERWLLEADDRVRNIGQEVKTRNISRLQQERDLWNIGARVSNTKTGYRLDLLSIWTGPTSSQNKFYFKRSCKIEPVAIPIDEDNSSSNTETVAELECQPIPMFLPDTPPPKS
ncbi:MAG: septal junction protein FraD [Cyanobacteria bacterium P01_A01_bin.45]